MKLVIQARAAAPSTLIVIDGNKVVQITQAYGPELKQKIDTIFEEKYIESVQFTEHNSYTKKFEDYIMDTHEGIMVE